MKITVLGTRGEINVSAPYHRWHSGILIDDTLLFDLGEKEFLSHNPAYVFITHMHPDHAYFIRQREAPPSNGVIYVPEEYTFREHETSPKQDTNAQAAVPPLRFLSKPFTWHGYTVTAIPTEHSLKVKSQAYLIEKDGIRVLYTGDLFWIEKKYHHLFGNLDLVITDGSHIKEGGVIRRSKVCEKETGDGLFEKEEGDGVIKELLKDEQCILSEPFGHTGIPNLMRLFAPHTHRILFVHFGTWFYTAGAQAARATIKKYGKQYGIEPLVGYDGMVITLDKGGIR